MSSLKKIAVIGGESTGKSTLSIQLANHYHTNFVPEYAREYIENLNRAYQLADLYTIALGQIEQENKFLATASQYLFCDTTLDVIEVWSNYKYSCCDKAIVQLNKSTNYDAYFITAPDVVWQPDVQREHPEPQLRKLFFEQYIQIVQKKNKPFQILYGNKKKRLSTAIAFLEDYFPLLRNA